MNIIHDRSFRWGFPEDADGNKVCPAPNCGRRLPKYRRRWCSNEHMSRGFNTTFANAIHWRDGSICAICGVDCDLLRYWLDNVPWPKKRKYRQQIIEYKQAYKAILIERGFDLNVHELWEADHILPLCEGGKNTWENGRILCHPCHKRITCEMHQRRTAARSSPPSLSSTMQDLPAA